MHFEIRDNVEIYDFDNTKKLKTVVRYVYLSN